MPAKHTQSIAIIGAPMDLGTTRRGVDMGPSAIRFACLSDRLAELGHTVADLGNIPVPARETLPRKAEYPIEAIADCCEALAEIVAQAVESGNKPLVLGGDHSVAMGSVAGVANAHAKRSQRIGVIWVDAHGDMNTPETTLTGNVHGMPLAHLLGHGHPRLSSIAQRPPAVLARNAVVVGVRDLDPGETVHINEWGVTAFSMRDVDERGLRAVMSDAIERAMDGTAGFYLSVDADWVDPDEAPGVGTPVRGGATFREAHLAMELAHDSGGVLGMDFVEVNPIYDVQNRTGQLGVGLIASAFGLRILDRRTRRSARTPFQPAR